MIETDRLFIRQFKPEDAQDVYECCNDYDVVKTTLGMPWPYTEQDAQNFIEYTINSAKENKSHEYAICFKENPNKIIGCVALVGIKEKPKRAEIGYWVGKKYWKQGIATEAAKAMLEYGFKNLGLHSVIARYFDINPASGRVMEKCGMKYVGTIRDHEFRFDRYYNVGYYEMLETDLTK